MTEDARPALRAELTYLDPRTTHGRQFIAPGARVATELTEKRPVDIRDGRPVRDSFALDVQGFALVDHRSAVPDFTDPVQLEQVYVAEVCRFVQEQLGADQVLSRGWELRRSVAPAEHGAQPPAAGVHVDYAPGHIPGMVARAHARHFPDGPDFRRAVVTSTWRVFSPPPQDWPLALCESRTIAPDDGAPITTYFVDELPADPFGPVDHLKPVGSSWKVRHDPAHEWWWFPAMTRDEVLLIKLGDTGRGGAWAAPHTAFPDPAAQGAVPRHSIELRTFAYFH
ncbi:CmcJ/NvfI family oxidoreductase [Modestobacter altitudinis]|uniref:CmcJ/NvfI family oxidoreductase n=1 Tax=Modestobacter altitudinis TaxID=2213158 RepID=UPI00110CF282|nr:CmcJ/NvfI family oxidoreductase [Modestobacter altitudinis]